ncbi:MAG: Crp/Fnr family transcriptional regulator [Paracoccaceae bacterium]|nr:Crp/Fnr family transcriptional regulator [Paracoccaceae bacterium]
MIPSSAKQARTYLYTNGWLADRKGDFASEILELATFHEAEAGEVIYTYGQFTDGLYGVVSGLFAYSIAPNERGPHTLFLFRPGFWFGEMEIFDNREKTGSIIATRKSSYLHISRKSLVDLAKINPDTWRQVGHLCSQHLEIAIGMFDDSIRRQSEKRVIALLLWLGGVRHSQNPADPHPEIDITQADLARLSSMSRPSVNAHLKRLASENLLEHAYGCIRLLQVERLRQMLD